MQASSEEGVTVKFEVIPLTVTMQTSRCIPLLMIVFPLQCCLSVSGESIILVGMQLVILPLPTAHGARPPRDARRRRRRPGSRSALAASCFACPLI